MAYFLFLFVILYFKIAIPSDSVRKYQFLDIFIQIFWLNEKILKCELPVLCRKNAKNTVRRNDVRIYYSD